MLYQIQIEDCQNKMHNISDGLVTLEQANALTKEYEMRWQEWAEHGFPELTDPNDPLGHWEGCEVIAVGDDGKTFLLQVEEDEWENLDDDCWEVYSIS